MTTTLLERAMTGIKRTCTHGDCRKLHKANGLCGTHYERQRTGRPLDPPVRQYETGERLCKEKDCGLPRAPQMGPDARSKSAGSADYCPMHLMRVKRTGTARGPERERSPSGEAVWDTPEYRRRYWRLKKYGLTPEEFDRMLASQGGRCAICRVDTPKTARLGTWCVDHDHVTGRVRGLLCGHCNRALGLFGDDPDVIASAVRYVLAGRDVLNGQVRLLAVVPPPELVGWVDDERDVGRGHAEDAGDVLDGRGIII